MGHYDTVTLFMCALLYALDKSRPWLENYKERQHRTTKRRKIIIFCTIAAVIHETVMTICIIICYCHCNIVNIFCVADQPIKSRLCLGAGIRLSLLGCSPVKLKRFFDETSLPTSWKPMDLFIIIINSKETDVSSEMRPVWPCWCCDTLSENWLAMFTS